MMHNNIFTKKKEDLIYLLINERFLIASTDNIVEAICLNSFLQEHYHLEILTRATLKL